MELLQKFQIKTVSRGKIISPSYIHYCYNCYFLLEIEGWMCVISEKDREGGRRESVREREEETPTVLFVTYHLFYSNIIE